MTKPDFDAPMMARALALGRRGLGAVWPNPAVGCVVVNNGRIVGRGTTAKGGRPHAETQALDQAGDQTRGGTAYVTLEPCAHQGQTPPCTQALINAGIARVVVAHVDPHPDVNENGIDQLRAAGIAVDVGCGRDQAARDHAGFFSVVNRKRPFLTLKIAASLDGRIATASGESRWITGPSSRALAHHMRATHDLVLVGGGTARADDPDLRVRNQGARNQPVRAVASRYLDLLKNSRLSQSADASPVWLIHGPGADLSGWSDTPVTLIETETGPDRQLSPLLMLKTLADRGITRVFCEGGGSMAASLLAAGLVDELVVFHAGLTLGAEGTPGIGALGLGALGDAPRFDLTKVSAIGSDTVEFWRPRAAG